MEYIRVPAVMEKLKTAERDFRPVFMTAATGFGKTAAARFVSRKRPALWLSVQEGELSEKPLPAHIRRSLVIIDNLQGITDSDSKRYIKNLLRIPGLQVFLLSRGTVPPWLQTEEVELDFVRITEHDLRITGDAMRLFMESLGIQVPEEDLPLLEAASRGYSYALFYYAKHMENGARFSEQMEAAVWEDIYHLWEGDPYESWSLPFRDFGLAVAPYDAFTAEMASLLTGDAQIYERLEFCRNSTSQISVQSDGTYVLRPEIRRFFIWKRSREWSQERQKENYRRAALYYELHGEIREALKFYETAGAAEQLKDLLIRNLEKHPGVGHYYDIREYYFRLPREEALDSPVLMAGLSMLYSLMLDPDRSEEWYRELAAFEKKSQLPEGEKREAAIWLAYLDISLPHRGIRGVIQTVRNTFRLTKSGHVLPEMSVTGNMPSLMNGGLDFCEWSKKDTQLARLLGQPMELVLGKYGSGLVSIALGESGFEKGTLSSYEVCTKLSEGFGAASHGGKIELCFAASGVLARQHLLEGHLLSAERQRDVIRMKAEQEKAVYLMPNLEAFEAWLALYSGDSERRRAWMEGLTDEKTDFCVLDRYRSIVKLRCLIAENRLEEARDLSLFLTGYLTRYERHFLWMENELMKSVILYRTGDPAWREILKGALRKTAEYHFVRVISLEGAAILPLLHEADWGEAPKEYRKQVLRETEQTALRYPNYLSYVPKAEIRLTPREAQVLSMLCIGMGMEEICAACGISYAGLKKHNRSIYRKLGASNRAEAERKAAQLGLVNR